MAWSSFVCPAQYLRPSARSRHVGATTRCHTQHRAARRGASRRTYTRAHTPMGSIIHTHARSRHARTHAAKPPTNVTRAAVRSAKPLREDASRAGYDLRADVTWNADGLCGGFYIVSLRIAGARTAGDFNIAAVAAIFVWCLTDQFDSSQLGPRGQRDTSICAHVTSAYGGRACREF